MKGQMCDPTRSNKVSSALCDCIEHEKFFVYELSLTVLIDVQLLLLN